jgi:hypothetical protein
VTLRLAAAEVDDAEVTDDRLLLELDNLGRLDVKEPWGARTGPVLRILGPFALNVVRRTVEAESEKGRCVPLVSGDEGPAVGVRLA